MPREAVRGHGAERITPTSRYGVLLVLLFITFVFMASAPSGHWVQVVTAALVGMTLITAVFAAGAQRRLVRIVLVVAPLTFVASLVSFVTTPSAGEGVIYGLNVLLIAGAPVVIADSIWRRGVIDVQTELGAISIYVLIGLVAAFLYASIADLSSSQFFVQQRHATTADFVYYSYVTLTTTGYGDLTAAGNIGRSVSILEAMLGQLYLVTVVAVVIGRLGRRSARSSDA